MTNNSSPTSPQVLQTYALLQIAAEAFLGYEPNASAAAPGDAPSVLPSVAMLTEGNKHSSRMTSAIAQGVPLDQTQARQFINDWEVVSHQPNTATGFSATLFRCKTTDPARGMTAGQLVISFRSTEFIEDSARDNQATNTLEVKEGGWAFGQIDDMQKWYATQVAPLLTNGAKVDVTGYSLGGHLATAFYELHADKINSVYTFNGAGVGTVNPGKSLAGVIAASDLRRARGANASMFKDSRARGVYTSLLNRYPMGAKVSSVAVAADVMALNLLNAANETEMRHAA